MSERANSDGTWTESRGERLLTQPPRLGPVSEGGGAPAACYPVVRRKWSDAKALCRSEIPTDSLLPEIPTMLDPANMGQIFQDELSADFRSGRYKIIDSRIAKVKYMPARYCQVSYDVEIQETATGQRGTEFLTTKHRVRDYSRRYIAEIAGKLQTRPRFCPPFAFLQHRRMFVTAFPNDEDLSGLGRCLTPGGIEPVLRRSLGLSGAGASGSGHAAARITILSYRPERSCLFRIDLQPESKTTEKNAPKVVYARMYRGRGGERVFQGMQQLWDGDARRAGELSIAEPLGYDPESGILFQGIVEGVPLPELAKDENYLDYVGMAARSLAAIHRTPARLPKRHLPEGALEILESAVRIPIRFPRNIHDNLEAVLRRLRRTLPGPGGQVWVPIHGDFVLGQVLVGAGRVGIIDFDHVQMGEACADVGRVLATFGSTLAQARRPGGLAGQKARVFRSEYEAACGGKLASDRLAWYHALRLVTAALAARQILRPGWPGQAANLLNRAQFVLDGDGGGK